MTKVSDPSGGNTFQKQPGQSDINKNVLNRFTLMFAMGWGEAVSTSRTIVGDDVTISAANVDIGSNNDNSYDVSVSAAPLLAAMPKPGRIKAGANGQLKPTDYNISLDKDQVVSIIVTPGAQDPTFISNGFIASASGSSK